MALPLDDRRNKQPATNLMAPFDAYVREVLGNYNHGGRLSFYTSITTVANDLGDWALKPHRHSTPSRVVIHFLQSPDSGGELCITDGLVKETPVNIVEAIKPEPGVTVIFDDDLPHGVRKIQGGTPRMALICLARGQK